MMKCSSKHTKSRTKFLKGDLTTKLEEGEPPAAEQSPHRYFGVGLLAAQLLCEATDALGDRKMVCRLWHEPLTRRLTS
jgi:hypothetical protein